MSPPYQAFTDSGLQAFYGASLQARGPSCAGCQVLLGETFTITTTSLPGDYAPANGSRSITITDSDETGCFGDVVVTGTILIRLHWDLPHDPDTGWEVLMTRPGIVFNMEFIQDDDLGACNPIGAYSDAAYPSAQCIVS